MIAAYCTVTGIFVTTVLLFPVTAVVEHPVMRR
jgi:hypothetical protein